MNTQVQDFRSYVSESRDPGPGSLVPGPGVKNPGVEESFTKYLRQTLAFM